MVIPWSSPRRTAARAAVFMPGASPPAWMIATRRAAASSLADGAAASWCSSPSAAGSSSGGVDMVSKMDSIWPKLFPRAATAPSKSWAATRSLTARVAAICSIMGRRWMRLWRSAMMTGSESVVAVSTSRAAAHPSSVDIQRS